MTKLNTLLDGLHGLNVISAKMPTGISQKASNKLSAGNNILDGDCQCNCTDCGECADCVCSDCDCNDCDCGGD